jgi:hypothetical protein
MDPAAVWIGVGSSVVQHGVDTTLADITAGTGALATRKPITAWGTSYVLNDGRAAVDGPLMTWRPASAAEAQSIGVWYMADALTAGNLLAYGLVNPAVQLADETDQWALIMRLTLDPAAKWSAEISFNG